METFDLDNIYNNIPETGTTTKNFANFTADPKCKDIFQSHLNRINLINFNNLRIQSTNNDQPICSPDFSATEIFSGPLALNLAQEGKKVMVQIFADSTNVGGIYMTNGSPAGTQEEQTILMTPEIYSFLGNNYGVWEIGGNGDGIYSAKQKRYNLNKNDYENSDLINPAYGYILTNLLMTHNIEQRSIMIKLPKEEIVEVSYAFLSMPSFATDISKDPIGAILIGKSGENDGDKIYQTMKESSSILKKKDEIMRRISIYKLKQDIGKISIFYPISKLQDFSNCYMKDKNYSLSNVISIIVEANIIMKQNLNEKDLIDELKLKDYESFKRDVINIIEESQKNYDECILTKFTNLIKGTESSGCDTLIVGKCGCGAFLNDETEIAALMGKAIAKCKTIKYIYFSGLKDTDPFIDKVKASYLACINEKNCQDPNYSETPSFFNKIFSIIISFFENILYNKKKN